MGYMNIFHLPFQIYSVSKGYITLCIYIYLYFLLSFANKNPLCSKREGEGHRCLLPYFPQWITISWLCPFTEHHIFPKAMGSTQPLFLHTVSGSSTSSLNPFRLNGRKYSPLSLLISVNLSHTCK